MKEALEGVPPAPLPLGTWRDSGTPNPDAPTPPLDLSGTQTPTGGRGGRPPQPAAPPQGYAPPAPVRGGRGGGNPAADAGPIPPAPIPNAGASAGSRNRGLLDKLFGTP